MIPTVVWKICFLGNFNSSISLGKIQQADISSLNFTWLWWKRITYKLILYYFPQLSGEKTASSLLCRCPFLAFHGRGNAMAVQVCAIRKKTITFVYRCIISRTSFYLPKCNFSITHLSLQALNDCFIKKIGHVLSKWSNSFQNPTSNL